jgi:putative restriction endonuclease
MKAVFETRAQSGYDDAVETRYHFPKRYLDPASQAEGDWIVYREPRRAGGRSGYVAVARVRRIDRDPADPDHAYARLEHYLPFDRVVPIQEGAAPYERLLRDIAPNRWGATLRGRSVRDIADDEFNAIVRAGLSETLSQENARRLDLVPDDVDGETRTYLELPQAEQERRVQEILLNRKIRDASFRKRVCDAYGDTCAVTGLRMVNGGGRPEVQAAHILPVADGGPDLVQNGVALSGTVHWLFDRHLISVDEEHRLLVSHNRVPNELQQLFQRQRERILLPRDCSLWPHPRFLRHHLQAFASA